MTKDAYIESRADDIQRVRNSLKVMSLPDKESVVYYVRKELGYGRTRNVQERQIINEVAENIAEQWERTDYSKPISPKNKQTAPTLSTGLFVYIVLMVIWTVFNERIGLWCVTTLLFIGWSMLEILKYNTGGKNLYEEEGICKDAKEEKQNKISDD